MSQHGDGTVEKQKEMIFNTTCKRNPAYPKATLVCGEIRRIKDPQALPERFVDGDWLLLAYIK